MNILFVSCLNGDSWAGPTYSVPQQIKAQSEFDNICWYNVCNSKVKEWSKLEYYHDITEFPSERLSALPSPFCTPDLIVVEQFYGFVLHRIMRDIMRSKVPYIIIPRGELVANAQNRKSIKKKLGNLLIFNRFAKKATALLYLTKQEQTDSGTVWNKSSIIVPNGIVMPSEKKQVFSEDGVKFIFIGRLSPFHKGLDMLIEACIALKDLIIKTGSVFSIYGPDYDNQKSVMEKQIADAGLGQNIRFFDGIFGDEKKKILLENDVFLIPSRFEGHPMALIEALSYGLPCVATTGSNMRPEIEEYNAGFTADVSADSVKSAIENAILQKESFAEMSDNSVRLAKEYAWNKIAEKAHSEYCTLLNVKE